MLKQTKREVGMSLGAAMNKAIDIIAVGYKEDIKRGTPVQNEKYIKHILEAIKSWRDWIFTEQQNKLEEVWKEMYPEKISKEELTARDEQAEEKYQVEKLQPDTQKVWDQFKDK